MNSDLDKKLCKDYPNLYKDRNGDMRNTCMCWGFPGDGWYKLIDELSAVLEPLGIVATQVKEKFGGLRFYVYGLTVENNEEVQDAIEEAERKSVKTCEICGEPGKTRGYTYIKTLCDKCDEERHVDENQIMDSADNCWPATS